MTTPHTARPDDTPLVGVRTHTDIELALKDQAGHGGPPPFAAGAAAAYGWALGRSDRSPITGTGAAQGFPGLPLLTAEVDASVVQLDDATTQGDAREYIRGVHDALAWICGYSDQPA
ncbi:hypothetical protein GCM10009730_03970 [Streptomyces albidochromogenes]|uniref:hypothetical protein n=1 Tax=Streptomyces albidochromogenes TaxID=329524 RepID=UPI00110FCD09|nr:hypothetical protein [Streptomyces albidochromogenes]